MVTIPIPRAAGASAILLCLLWAGCTSVSPGDGTTPAGRSASAAAPLRGSLPVRLLLQEYNTGLRDSTRRVITDGVALAALWGLAYEGRGEVPSLPRIDFDREMVVVAALGTRASGGYTIQVDSARATDRAVEVFVRRLGPGPTCGTTAALTEPAVVVAIPRSDAPVRFLETSTLHDCG